MSLPPRTVTQSTPNAPAIIRPGQPGQVQPASVQQVIQAPAGSRIFMVSVRPPTQPVTTLSTSAPIIGTGPQQLQSVTPSLQDYFDRTIDFLTNLFRIAEQRAPDTFPQVKNLTQIMIDGNIQPEVFVKELERLFNSPYQPTLVGILQNGLPLVREALKKNAVRIDGIRAPTMSVGPTVVRLAQPQSLVRLAQPQSLVRLAKPQSLVRLAHPQSLVRPAIRPQQPSMIWVKRAPVQSTQQQLTKVLPAGRPTLPRIIHSGVQPPKVNPAPTTNLQESLKDNDDVNDVVAMGGVDLDEESKNNLATGTKAREPQKRSCTEDHFLNMDALALRMKRIAQRKGLKDVSPKALRLISHATEQKLRTIMETLSLTAEHRTQNYRVDNRFVEESNVRGQLKFLKDLDESEKKRHSDHDREVLLRAAKSRSKKNDSEQDKLKQKVKEMKTAEMAEIQHQKANKAALAAIGSRKKRKLDDSDLTGATGGANHSLVSGANGFFAVPSIPNRPRIKKVTVKDLIFVMEKDPFYRKSSTLFKAYHK